MHRPSRTRSRFELRQGWAAWRLSILFFTELHPHPQLQLFAHDYYFGDPNATCYPDPVCTYRWPATAR